RHGRLAFDDNDLVVKVVLVVPACGGVGVRLVGTVVSEVGAEVDAIGRDTVLIGIGTCRRHDALVGDGDEPRPLIVLVVPRLLSLVRPVFPTGARRFSCRGARRIGCPRARRFRRTGGSEDDGL
ncbi:hypothetical protein DN545_39570, partial [Burkholderia multivorans]